MDGRDGARTSSDEALEELLGVVWRQAHRSPEFAHGHDAEGGHDQGRVLRVPVLVLDLSNPHAGEGRVAQDDVDRGVGVGLQVDEQQQKVRRREDVVQAVPLELREEDLHAERVAEVVQEARAQLEDTDVQLEMPPVAVHDHQRRNKRNVRQHLEYEGEHRLTQRV